MKTVHAFLAGAMLLAGSAFADAVAQEIQLPSTVSWTSYDVGSSGYVQAVAIGAALSDAYSTNLRVLPATSDVARVLPVKQGRVDFALLGSESFNAVEGTVAFADPQLGPQQLQMLYGANSDNCFTLALQGDLTVSGADDLRGKRIGWVVGSPALQENVAAFLAFYGLTWDDVEKVDVPSFAGSWEAFLNGQVDAVTTLTTVSFATQAAASPSGLNWLALPASDKEGWEKLRMIKPQFAPRVGTAGANMSKDKSVECAGFPFPVLLAYPDQDDKQKLNNPVWHIHSGNPPKVDVPVSFALLLNLVSASHSEDPAALWGFIRNYAPGASPQTHPDLDRLVGYAINYFHDFVKPNKKYRAPDETERKALADLAGRLKEIDPKLPAEEIQNIVYAVGKENGFENLRDWFKALYEVLLGESQGPRFGSFVALYGVEATVALIEQALAGEDLSAG